MNSKGGKNNSKLRKNETVCKKGNLVTVSYVAQLKTWIHSEFAPWHHRQKKFNTAEMKIMSTDLTNNCDLMLLVAQRKSVSATSSMAGSSQTTPRTAIQSSNISTSTLFRNKEQNPEETGERGDFPFRAGQLMAGLPFLLGKAPWTTICLCKPCWGVILTHRQAGVRMKRLSLWRGTGSEGQVWMERGPRGINTALGSRREVKHRPMTASPGLPSKHRCAWAHRSTHPCKIAIT